jgi:hypothetical protein
MRDFIACENAVLVVNAFVYSSYDFTGIKKVLHTQTTRKADQRVAA